MSIPSIIFIVPYRDREQHKSTYIANMVKYMELHHTNQQYEIYISHQHDGRHFNRGAMKNIGFIHAREKYPNDYKNITFVFNDIDTYPIQEYRIDYNTQHNIVKHFFGFNHALGGIFSITGETFEKINGFPNYWGWGLEDNVLQHRIAKIGATIDYSQFTTFYDNVKYISQDQNNVRILDPNMTQFAMTDRLQNGLTTIRDLDKCDVSLSDTVIMVNASNFICEFPHENCRMLYKTIKTKQEIDRFALHKDNFSLKGFMMQNGSANNFKMKF
jgi:hypothetical protein